MKANAKKLSIFLLVYCLSAPVLTAQEFDMTVLNAPSTSTQQCFYVHISTDYVADAITITGNGEGTTCSTEQSCPITICFDRPTFSYKNELIECEVTQGNQFRQDGCTVLIWPSFAPEAPFRCQDLRVVAECGFMNPCNPCEVAPSSITHLTVGVYNANGNFEYLGLKGWGNIQWYNDKDELVHNGAWVNYSPELTYVRMKLYLIDGSTPEMDCGISTDIHCNSSARISQHQPSALLEQTLSLQNYPNPFSNTTTISFSLKEASPISLKVLDNTGKEVASLLENSTYSAGQHQIDLDGRHYSPGVYFYILHTSEGSITQKMNIVR